MAPGIALPPHAPRRGHGPGDRPPPLPAHALTLGRPDGTAQEKYSMKPVVPYLEKIAGKSVTFLSDCVGPEGETAGADPAATNAQGRTALHAATSRQLGRHLKAAAHAEEEERTAAVVQLLLQCGMLPASRPSRAHKPEVFIVLLLCCFVVLLCFCFPLFCPKPNFKCFIFLTRRNFLLKVQDFILHFGFLS